MTTPADEKLLAEAEKLRAEARDLRRHPFGRPTTWIPLLLALGAGVGGLLTGYFQWQLSISTAATSQLESERKQLLADRKTFELEQKNKDLTATNQNLAGEAEQKRAAVEQTRLELANLQTKLDSVKTQLAQSPAGSASTQAAQTELATATEAIQSITANLQRQTGTVFLQFKGSMSRDTMRELQRALQDSGYNAPGTERVDADYTTEVRFFHDADTELATQVAADVSAFLSDKCAFTGAVPTKKVNLRSPPGQVEVWLDVNCQ